MQTFMNFWSQPFRKFLYECFIYLHYGMAQIKYWEFLTPVSADEVTTEKKLSQRIPREMDSEEFL